MPLRRQAADSSTHRSQQSSQRTIPLCPLGLPTIPPAAMQPVNSYIRPVNNSNLPQRSHSQQSGQRTIPPRASAIKEFPLCRATSKQSHPSAANKQFRPATASKAGSSQQTITPRSRRRTIHSSYITNNSINSGGKRHDRRRL